MTSSTLPDPSTPASPETATATPDGPLPVSPSVRIEALCDAAVRRVAPLWSLESFVAVNPWVGLEDHPVDKAALRMARVAGARSTMPRTWYVEAIRRGRISDSNLRRALATARARARDRATILHRLPRDVRELRARVEADAPFGGVPSGTSPESGSYPVEPTIADAAERLDGRHWEGLVAARISTWAADHFDRGQAAWRSPWADEGPWHAWLLESQHDRTPELEGVAGFRAFVRTLPREPERARARLLTDLGLREDKLENYLHRLLMRVGGWAAWTRRRLWEAELDDADAAAPTDLLTILLAWEVALLGAFEERGVRRVWHEMRHAAEVGPERERAEIDIRIDLLLQDALEHALQDELVERFDRQASTPVSDTTGDRPTVQAAFCIDVRSEVYRRALERVLPDARTLGFAGFFGVPLEYVGLGDDEGSARCPVLLRPAARIREVVPGDASETDVVAERRTLRRRATAVWKAFKMGAVSCFGFVGPIGLAYAAKLVTDGLGLTRPAPRPGRDGLEADEVALLAPELTPGEDERGPTGMSPATRVDTAEAVLHGMSLTRDFARVVMLAGHGSSTVNNPHATGLDCGACAGQSGEPNARVAAALFNDPGVRRGLADRDLEIPDDTLFVAALHDTTTDEVTLHPPAGMPATHVADLDRLRGALRSAGRIARAERAPRLGIDPTGDVDGAVLHRARDWSQMRPEWGLAGCSSFVAAPRERTRGLDLGGRSFLHSYDWRQDEGFEVLELILTAPVIVASWISLQYYGSTVDNRVFGSGNKTLHNVVGTLGVLEGNGGDLRVGLPEQSVHDGIGVAHEPVRLNVIVEAPIEAMNDVIRGHEHLRHLVDHGWLHLWAMGASGRLSRRYVGGGRWVSAHPAAGRRTEGRGEVDAA